jgi:WD repeat-containing protein 19
MYEAALKNPDNFKNKSLISLAEAGLLRQKLRMGEIAFGMKLLRQCNDHALIMDCAAILEQRQQLLEAAILYEKVKMYDKAAELYIKSKLEVLLELCVIGVAKNFGKVAELIPQIQSAKLLTLYAAAQEGRVKSFIIHASNSVGEKNFVEAAKAYKQARDNGNYVRVLVSNLKQIDEVHS